MAWTGIYHTDVGGTLTEIEYDSTASHQLSQGTSLPVSPNNYDLFLKTDEKALYIYIP